MKILPALLLLLISLSARGVPAPSVSFTVAAPGLVRLTWQQAADVTEYNVYVDGVYHTTIAPRQTSGSTVFVGASGVYCAVGLHRLGDQLADSACSDNMSLAVPLPPQGEFTLELAQTRFDLQEGDASGLIVPIAVSRFDGRPVPIELGLYAETPDGDRNLVVRFDHSVLAEDQASTQLNVALGVAMAPVDNHERRFLLVGSDGLMRQEVPLIFNIKPVAAPDVYLLIGQSNMVGSSEGGARNSQPGGPDASNERIHQLNVVPNNRHSIFRQAGDFTNESTNVLEPRLVVAADPLHEPLHPGQPGKGGTHIGLGMSFAKSALQRTTQQIYLVPAAWGATGFCANQMGELAWNAAPTGIASLGGTWLTDRALTRLNMTLRDTGGILRGILWHQGGADSNNSECAHTYADNLSRLVARLRSEASVDARGSAARGPDAPVPFIVGTQSKGRDEHSDFSQFSPTKIEVDTVHRSVSSLIPFADFVNHDDLVPPSYPCGSGSCVHFGAAAYREMGVRFDQAIKRVIDQHADR